MLITVKNKPVTGLGNCKKDRYFLSNLPTLVFCTVGAYFSLAEERQQDILGADNHQLMTIAAAQLTHVSYFLRVYSSMCSAVVNLEVETASL